MRKGEVGMIWENSTETCILPYVKQITSPSWMHETGHSKSVLCDSPEGGDGREVGGVFRMGDTCNVHPWLIHVSVWQKPLQYCKVISLQLKYINFFFFLKNFLSFVGEHKTHQPGATPPTPPPRLGVFCSSSSRGRNNERGFTGSQRRICKAAGQWL